MDETQEQLDANEETKALLIQLREYVIIHDQRIGECCAWMTFKKQHEIGIDREAEIAWLRDYLRKHPTSKANRGPVAAEYYAPRR